ncbi:hypothetical protein M9H77_22413 [Catharanthus roseus]|uniref:Uncharacterized protein n=1 Tax=Catharanthus roseus TaxID=4058 RepID=A0ACC0ARV9_CATRO|nr:hypothetical protein M9H77_22413 [Catharanthus roseus]
MGKDLTIHYEYTSISLSSNPFLLCHEFSSKELKLFLELHASHVTLVGNVMVNPFTCNLALNVDHMFKFSSLCAYFEKQLLFGVARIKPSYHDLELLYDNLFFDLLVANFSTSYASIWSKIHILLESFSIQLLCFLSHRFEFPHDEQKVFIVDEFLKALLLGNFHRFQFYHFHCKEFMWLLFCGKKMNSSLKVIKVHLCDLVKTTFENGVFELTLKYLDEKLVYSISFTDYLLKGDILKDFLVQNTNSCVKLLNQSFGGTLLHSQTFKEFFKELIFKIGFKILHVFVISQSCSLLKGFLVLFLKNLYKNFLFYHHPSKEIFRKHDLTK